MAKYLLDADAVIDLLNGFPPAVRLIAQFHEDGDELAISEITVAEVYSGLRTADEAVAVQFFDGCTYLAPSLAAARRAGQFRNAMLRRGIALSITDALIAATAWEHAHVLVTGDAVFQYLPDIEIVPLPKAIP